MLWPSDGWKCWILMMFQGRSGASPSKGRAPFVGTRADRSGMSMIMHANVVQDKANSKLGHSRLLQRCAVISTISSQERVAPSQLKRLNRKTQFIWTRTAPPRRPTHVQQQPGSEQASMNPISNPVRGVHLRLGFSRTGARNRKVRCARHTVEGTEREAMGSEPSADLRVRRAQI